MTYFIPENADDKRIFVVTGNELEDDPVPDRLVVHFAGEHLSSLLRNVIGNVSLVEIVSRLHVLEAGRRPLNPVGLRQ